MIGEWRASLDNLSEQYERDALTAVMTGSVSSIFSDDMKDRLTSLYEEYAEYASSDSEEAGAKMGELLARAQAIAQNEYNASDGARLMLESNKSLVNSIRNDAALRDEYHDAGYEMGLVFTRGIASAIAENSVVKLDDLTDEERDLYKQYGGSMRGGGKFAYGLDYVPYDNFPTMLHEGEGILTASENRSRRNNTQSGVTVNINNMVVREEADIDKIARELARQIVRASALVN